VEGVTIADSAFHSLMLVSPYKAGHPNEVKWTKIFTWRGNGDGINPFGNTLIEDCFIRTQDDSLYVNGLGIRRTVLWNDANGSSFVLSGLPQLADRKLVVEDCDVIYARAKWHHWSGGRVFNMRGEGGRAAGAGVIFRNINIEDPRPTLQQFFICMTMPEPYSKDAERRKAGDLSGAFSRTSPSPRPAFLVNHKSSGARPTLASTTSLSRTSRSPANPCAARSFSKRMSSLTGSPLLPAPFPSRELSLMDAATGTATRHTMNTSSAWRHFPTPVPRLRTRPRFEDQGVPLRFAAAEIALAAKDAHLPVPDVS
jgi:hypothetical protein